MGDDDADISERVGDVELRHEGFDGIDCVEWYPTNDEEKYYNSEILCGFDFSLLRRSKYS